MVVFPVPASLDQYDDPLPRLDAIFQSAQSLGMRGREQQISGIRGQVERPFAKVVELLVHRAPLPSEEDRQRFSKDSRQRGEGHESQRSGG